MKLFKIIRDALREMPWGIKFLTLLFCWMSLCLPVVFIPLPSNYYVINGEHVSFLEFWRRGGGPLVLGFGCLAVMMPTVSYERAIGRVYFSLLWSAGLWPPPFLPAGRFNGGRLCRVAASWRLSSGISFIWGR
jgi:hypothetical protein